MIHEPIFRRVETAEIPAPYTNTPQNIKIPSVIRAPLDQFTWALVSNPLGAFLTVFMGRFCVTY
jgi:hypothetical protein